MGSVNEPPPLMKTFAVGAIWLGVVLMFTAALLMVRSPGIAKKVAAAWRLSVPALTKVPPV